MIGDHQPTFGAQGAFIFQVYGHDAVGFRDQFVLQLKPFGIPAGGESNLLALQHFVFIEAMTFQDLIFYDECIAFPDGIVQAFGAAQPVEGEDQISQYPGLRFHSREKTQEWHVLLGYGYDLLCLENGIETVRPAADHRFRVRHLPDPGGRHDPVHCPRFEQVEIFDQQPLSIFQGRKLQ